MAALLTPALRRRFAALGPQDYGDDAREIVVGHFFLPGTGWDWWSEAEAEDGRVPGDAEYVIWPEGRAGR